MNNDRSQSNRAPGWRRWAFTAAWLVFIAAVIFCADRHWLTPVYRFITAYPGSDKAGHFVLIGGMAFLLNLSLDLRTVRLLGWGWLLGGVLVGVVCTLEEISQIWIPSRTFDLLDLAGDYAGIVFFGWLAKVVARRGGQV